MKSHKMKGFWRSNGHALKFEHESFLAKHEPSNKPNPIFLWNTQNTFDIGQKYQTTISKSELGQMHSNLF